MHVKLQSSLLRTGLLICLLTTGCGRNRKPEVVQVAPTAPEAGSVIAPAFLPEAGSTIRSMPEAGSVAESGRWPSPSFTPPKVKPKPKRMIPAISSEQRRFNELGAILANRELHRSAIPYPDSLPQQNPPNLPPELRHIHEAIQNIHMTKIDGDWLPVVSLFKSAEMLEKVFALDFDRPYGIHVTLTADTESAIKVLEEKAPEKLVHLGLTLDDVSDEGWRRLGQLPHIKSLQLLSGEAKKLELILKHDRFEAVTILQLPQNFDTEHLKSTLREMQNLRRITMNRSHPRTKPEMAPIYEALAEMPWLEHITIETGIADEQTVIKFLTEGDYRNLKSLRIYSEPLDWAVWELNRLPNVEEISLCMSPRSDWVVKAVNILSHTGKIRSLRLTPDIDDRNEPEPYDGATAAKLIGALSRHTALENLQIPMKVDSPKILEGLTHLPHLKTLPVHGLDLNQETLAILCRMPKLENLTVNKLAFGPESSHLMPWLPITTLHVEEEETLTDERAEMLGLAPRLRHVSWWGGNGMTRWPDHIPHIDFQEYE